MKLTKEEKRQIRHNLIVNMPYSLLHTLLHFKALSKYLEYSLMYYHNFFPTKYNYKYEEWNRDGHTWLDAMFFWSATSEGYEYWHNIANWLLEYCDNS